MPTNYEKIPEFKGMTARQAAEANKSHPVNAYKTQWKNLNFVGAFLNWAHNEEVITSVPAAKVKVTKPKGYLEKDARLPYSTQTLNAILRSPLYAGCKSATRRRSVGTEVIQDDYFWVPLVAMFSGMRLPNPPAPSLIRRIGRAVLPWPRAKKRKGADKTVLLLAALTLATVTGKAKSEDIVIAPMASRVSDTINTSALTDCWITAIRQMPYWMSDGDRTGDTLARFYGKGGIGVLVIVSGNRIELNNLELVGTTGATANR